MRTLELSVAVGLFVYLADQLSGHRHGYLGLHYLPFICVAAAVAHVWFEGYRWQMLPIYLVVAGCAMQAIVPRWTSDVQLQYFSCLTGLFLLGGGVVLSTVFPVFELPAPDGLYAVGTEVRHVVDLHRLEPAEPSNPRELMLQIWYPAGRSVKTELAPYQERATTTGWDAHFSLAKTHSAIDAPLAVSESRYPVVLYAPSWTGMRTENTHLAEQLASHGYVVVGMDHPYSSLATAFPDGRVIRTKLSDEGFYSSDRSFRRFLETAEMEIRIRADDARFVLDTLHDLNEADPHGRFTDRLNLNQIGIFGFSLGGGVAAQACWLDHRFKACLNMDGLMAGESLSRGTNAPLFTMSEADPLPPDSLANITPTKRREMTLDREQFVQMRALLSTYGGYWLTIKRAKHFNFSDYPFSSPIRLFGRSGAIAPTKAAQIVDKYALAFFACYLKGTTQPTLEDAPIDAPDFQFQKTRPALCQSGPTAVTSQSGK
ncbi:alpha/beta hydrolase family protein [Bradyrhizobium sp. ORS 86]|uniref:alpha/beta hydrolase family protein n=1 Tax=Bradyrhizobium sp. ORS 86 TaxID=1685970 RepID=UPI00388D2F19